MPWPSVPPGTHPVGPSTGRLFLRTARQGLAARAGHDLLIEVTGWSGVVQVTEEGTPADTSTGDRPATVRPSPGGPATVALDVAVDMRSFRVREGTGGVKPLSDRDRRQIETTLAGVLHVDRHPQAGFHGRGLTGDAPDGAMDGTLTLAGRSGPLRLAVSADGDEVRVRATVRQTTWGIEPYTGFFGALRLADEVAVEAVVPLGALTGAGG